MGPWLVEIRTADELEPWLAGGPPDRAGSTVMLVRGDGPDVRAFLPNALDAAKIDPRRVVVWIRDPAVPDDSLSADLFGDGRWCLAVVLGVDGRAAAWMTRDRVGVEDAAFAFTEAETMKKVDSANV